MATGRYRINILDIFCRSEESGDVAEQQQRRGFPRLSPGNGRHNFRHNCRHNCRHNSASRGPFVGVFVAALLVVTRFPRTVDACQVETMPTICYSEVLDFYQPCSMTPTDNIRCRYAKVNNSSPNANSESLDIPGPPRNFQIQSYTVRHYESCFQMFNLTWQLPGDSSAKSLQGFLLNFTFTHEGKRFQVLRRFNVTIKNLTTADWKKVVFSYHCLVPRPNTYYRIELHSQPSAPDGMQNYAPQLLQTQEYEVDKENSAAWKSSIWRTPKPEESTLEVCFTLAPETFGFTKYGVFLIGSEEPFTPRYSAGVEVSKKAAFACHQFTGVCSDTYRIEVEPVVFVGPGEYSCNCKLNSTCAQRCSTSVFENASMIDSRLPCIPPTTPPTGEFSSTWGGLGEARWRWILGLAIGLSLAFAAAGLISFIICKRRLLRAPRQKVVIFYSSDFDDSLEFIRSFAEFLRVQCACDVVLENCLEGRHSDVELDDRVRWKIQQITTSDCSLFVMPNAVCRRYLNVLIGSIQPPTSQKSMDNLAIVADFTKLMGNAEYKPLRHKCYQIGLPTDFSGESLLRELVERKYELPGDTKDLLKTVCGSRWVSENKRDALRQMVVRYVLEPDQSQPLLVNGRAETEQTSEVTVSLVSSRPSSRSSSPDEGCFLVHTIDNNNRNSCSNLNNERLRIANKLWQQKESFDSAYCTSPMTSESFPQPSPSVRFFEFEDFVAPSPSCTSLESLTVDDPTFV